MILYLDASALVRLYIEEEHHAVMVKSVRSATLCATHLIAYAEMRASLQKLRRMKRLTDKELTKIKRAFEKDWLNIAHIQPTDFMMRRAGELAEQHNLRGYDSVHLAAADTLAANSAPQPLVFACFDTNLNTAAQKLGMQLLIAS